MNARDKALRLDAEERPREAAAAYEVAIEVADSDLETYLNLAVLYWVATDFGYAGYHKLENAFVERAGRRDHEILDEGERRFGSNNEIDFWRYYFDYVSLGEAARPGHCKTLAERGPSLVPYFHLFELADGRRHRDEAKELLALFDPPETERGRYIYSMLPALRGSAE